MTNDSFQKYYHNSIRTYILIMTVGLSVEKKNSVH